MKHHTRPTLRVQALVHVGFAVREQEQCVHLKMWNETQSRHTSALAAIVCRGALAHISSVGCPQQHGRGYGEVLAPARRVQEPGLQHQKPAASYTAHTEYNNAQYKDKHSIQVWQEYCCVSCACMCVCVCVISRPEDVVYTAVQTRHLYQHAVVAGEDDEDDD